MGGCRSPLGRKLNLARCLSRLRDGGGLTRGGGYRARANRPSSLPSPVTVAELSVPTCFIPFFPQVVMLAAF